MSENLGDAVLTLRTDDRPLERGLAQGEQRAEATAARFRAIGGRMVNVGARLSAAVTLPLVAFGTMAANTASDAAELQSAFDQTFGAMAGDMNAWAVETGDAMGRSTQELQRAAAMFGIFFNQAAPTRAVAADMSQQFSILAQDLASFYNVDPGDAMIRLRAGLSGEAEPLRNFGVFLTEASVRARGLELGLGGVNGELSEQEKIMARANLIMEATTNAQGDVLRTSNSTANQLRAANAAWEEMQVAIGTHLLPVITPLITRVAELLGVFGELDPSTQRIILGVLGAAAVFGPLLTGAGALVSALGSLWPIVTGIAGAFGVAGASGGVATGMLARLLPLLGPVGIAISAMVTAWMLFGDRIGPVLQQLWQRLVEVLGPRLMAMFEAVRGALTELMSGPFGTLIRLAIDVLGDFLAAAISVFGEGTIRLLDALLATVTTVFTYIGDMLRLISRLLRGDFAGAWEAAQTLVRNSVTGMLDVIESLAPESIAAVRRMVEGVRDWLQTRLGAIFNHVRDRVRETVAIFDWLRNEVVGNSSVPDLVDGIADEFARLDDVMVRPAAKAAEQVAKSFETIPTPTIEGDGDAPDVAEADWRESARSAFSEGIKAALNGDLSGFLERWLSDAASRGLDTAITALASLIFGAPTGFGGQSGGGLFDVLGSIFAGGFATGGLIPAGQFGIVGERGPEPVIATPRGALVRPTSALSGMAVRPAAANINMPIHIDAAGADPAALARVRESVERLRSEMPATIVRTVQDASDRRIIGGLR